MMTFGGEFTPETRGAGSSAWTTSSFVFSSVDFVVFAGVESDLDNSGEDCFESWGVGGLISTVGVLSTRLSLESDFFTNWDSVRVTWIVGGGD